MPFVVSIRLKNGIVIACAHSTLHCVQSLMKSTIHTLYSSRCVCLCGYWFWRKWNSNDIHVELCSCSHSDPIRIDTYCTSFANDVCIECPAQITNIQCTFVWHWDAKHCTFLINYLGKYTLSKCHYEQFGSRPANHISLVRSIRFVRYDRVCAQLVTSAVVSIQHSEMKTIDRKKKMNKRRKCSIEQWSIVVMSTCFSPLAFPYNFIGQFFSRSHWHFFFSLFLLSLFGYFSILHNANQDEIDLTTAPAMDWIIIPSLISMNHKLSMRERDENREMLNYLITLWVQVVKLPKKKSLARSIRCCAPASVHVHKSNQAISRRNQLNNSIKIPPWTGANKSCCVLQYR